MSKLPVWLWSGACANGACLLGTAALAAVVTFAGGAVGQATPRAAVFATGELPEDPVPQGTGSQTDQAARPVEQPARRRASRSAEMIEPGEIAPKLSVPDKILLGLRASVSPVPVAGWFAASSLGYARDSAPMYAQTGEGFAQRLGASAARSASATVITDSIMASLFREDTRYYKMGVGHGVGRRTGYAVSRVFVTRTDGGRQTPNFALLIGNVASAATTQFYYPPVNRGAGDVAGTYGRSLAAAAVGFYVREFAGKWLVVLHLRREYF